MERKGQGMKKDSESVRKEVKDRGSKSEKEEENHNREVDEERM